MPDQEKIGIIAQSFQEQGYGLVLLCAFTDTDFRVRCFSTVPKHTIHEVLEQVASAASSLPFDKASVITGDWLLKSEPDMDEGAKWAAEYLEKEEPMVVACLSETAFSAFVVGDAPMLTFMAVRFITTLRQKGDFVLNPFVPSDN